MSSQKMRLALYLVASVFLATAAAYLSLPVWILFSGMAIYFGVKLFGKPATSSGKEVASSVAAAPGVLGRYEVDGSGEGMSYGLYVLVEERLVLVDLREDEHLAQRIAQAQRLAASSLALTESLARFRARNARYATRHIASIGLHSKNLMRGEVFWDPEGHTSLEDCLFTDD